MTRFVRVFLLVLFLSIIGGNRALSASIPVAISVHADIESDFLHIRGRATVPDGAWIIYAAYRVKEPHRRITGYVRTRDDRFSVRADISNWPPGKIVVDANFQIRLPDHKQPAGVIARFGRNGEHMRGEDVVQGGGGFRAAIASTAIEKHR